MGYLDKKNEMSKNQDLDFAEKAMTFFGKTPQITFNLIALPLFSYSIVLSLQDNTVGYIMMSVFVVIFSSLGIGLIEHIKKWGMWFFFWAFMNLLGIVFSIIISAILEFMVMLR